MNEMLKYPLVIGGDVIGYLELPLKLTKVQVEKLLNIINIIIGWHTEEEHG